MNCPCRERGRESEGVGEIGEKGRGKGRGREERERREGEESVVE